MARRFSVWNAAMSPTRPMIVRCTPRLMKASPPADSTRSTTASISSGAAPVRMTTTMVDPSRGTRRAPGRGPGLFERSVGASGVHRPGDPAGVEVELAPAHAAMLLHGSFPRRLSGLGGPGHPGESDEGE